MQDIAPGTCKVITGINAPGLLLVAGRVLDTRSPRKDELCVK